MEAENVTTTMKLFVTVLFFFLFLTGAFAQTRNVLVNTSGVVVQPTNFWSVDATSARSGLGLGSAATNSASAFQPSSSVLSNIASSNALNLTNLRASNIIGVISIANGGTGATNATDARIALDLKSASTNPSSAFQPSSTVLSNLSTSNAIGLTNVSANSIVGTVAIASNVTGTAPLATNVTGIVALVNGGTGGTNEASARTSLGATVVGANLFTLPNPDEVRFLRLNANNTVSSLNAVDFRNALSVGTNAGTVTSVGMTVPSIFSLNTSTITSSGTFGISLASQASRQVLIAPNGGGVPLFRAIESDDLPSLAISKVSGLQTALDGKLSVLGTASLATNVTGIISLANGGTGGTNVASARYNLGASTVGENIFTLFNPSAIRFLRINADNTVSAISDSDFRTSIGLGTASTNPSSAFQPSSSNLTNLAANNGYNLTNILVSNVIGALSTNGNGYGLTNLKASNITGVIPVSNIPTINVSNVIGALSTNGNGYGLTNLNASNISGIIPASNIPTINVSNVSGTIAISSGGTGATNAATARTNLGLGSTNSVSFGALTVADETYVGYAEIGWADVKIQFEERFFEAGSGLGWTFNQAPIFADVSGTRTNLGLSLAALTNTNITNFRTAIGLGSTNTVTFGNVSATSILHEGGATIAVDLADGILRNVSQNVLEFGDSAAIYAYLPIAFVSNSFAATTRTNLGLGSSWLTNTNVTNFRSAIGLGLSALTNTNASNFRSAIGLQWSALTNSNSGNSLISYNSSNNVIVGIVETNNISFSNSIVAPMFYGSDGTSTNIGGSINIGGNQSGSIDLSGANVALGGTGGSIIANATHSSTGGTLNMSGSQLGNGGSITTKDGGGSIDTRGNGIFSGGSIDTSLGGGLISTRGTGTLELGTNGTRTTITGTATTNRSISFPNGSGTIALLTNSSSGVSLVTVNSNGSVLSPTNFWQQAPIQTLVQSFVPVVNATNNVTNARNVYVYSSATNIVNVTNTLLLPTNSTTFDGDAVTVTHEGLTNTVTAVRQSGAATNFTTISNYAESVKFIREAGQWTFYHNISYVEPIRFTDGNIEDNRAISRTNLGLGLTALTNTNTTNFQVAIFSTNTAPTNTGNMTFGSAAAWMEINIHTNGTTNSYRIPLFNKP